MSENRRGIFLTHSVVSVFENNYTSISRGSSLPGWQTTDLLQCVHHEIPHGIGVGYGILDFGAKN